MNWIKTSERLPEEETLILYYFKVTGISIGYYARHDGEYPADCFYGNSGFLSDDVTHWMPLPEPPEGHNK